MEIGDYVKPYPPHRLPQGSGIYDGAVVASLSPFILISADGSALWRLTPTWVYVSRKASEDEMKRVMRRWNHAKTRMAQEAMIDLSEREVR